MKKLLVVCAAIALGTSAPAAADEFYAVTPSGRAEAYFDMPVVQTSDLLANKCIDLGWTVVSTTETIVTCQAPMSLGQSILASLAIGNQYSTPPVMFYRFNLAGSGTSTRVQVNGWIETQMAFGQVRHEDLAGAPFYNGAMDFFEAAGGRWPPGTRFPNHAWIGVHFDPSGVAQKVARIEEVDPDGPADRAGLMVGDVVTRIAGKKIKDGGDLLDALAKAHKSATYRVDYTRSGKSNSVTIDRVERSPIGGPPIDLTVAEAASPPAPSSAPLSVADEIAKLAKLRDNGILTDDEFDSEKAKLLAK